MHRANLRAKALLPALEDLGFEQEKILDNGFRSCFHRTEKKNITFENIADIPFKPTAIPNYKLIDDCLEGTSLGIPH